jgi:alpha-beta hydrolase superfamily lysophospholipase
MRPDEPAAPSRPARRPRLGALLALLLLLFLWLAISWLAAWFVTHPLTRPVRLPRDLAPPTREAAFAAPDGTRLSGWWFAEGERPAVVLCHGAFENRLGVIDCVPRLLAAGANVLSFDFRGRGRSGGGRSTLGKLEAEDVRAAVAWARAQPETAGRPVGVMGFSMGGAAVILAAAADGDIAAVLADSPYASLDRGIDRHLRTFLGPLAGTVGWPTRRLGEWMLGFDPRTLRPVDVVARLAPRPLLLIHGLGDFMTPPEDSQALAAAAGPSAQLWLVPRARHTKARRLVPAEYWARASTFWRAALATDGRIDKPQAVR